LLSNQTLAKGPRENKRRGRELGGAELQKREPDMSRKKEEENKAEADNRYQGLGGSGPEERERAKGKKTA